MGSALNKNGHSGGVEGSIVARYLKVPVPFSAVATDTKPEWQIAGEFSAMTFASHGAETHVSFHIKWPLLLADCNRN
jgi:hypothetical protein